jgi:WG containing repeat
VIPVKYETMGVFNKGLLITKDPETNRYGYLDKTGKWAIRATYLDGIGFDETGGAWVKMTDGKYHYINNTGKDFGAFDTISYKSFNRDGYALYEHTDFPYGLIDKNGTTISRLNDCDAIYTFSEGIAGYRCKSNSKYGFIDVNGKIIGACIYDGFSGFVDGIARIEMKVSGKTKYGYINSKGETILAPDYDDLRIFRNGWGIMKKDGNYFFVDKNGTTKEAPRKYDNLVEFRSGYAVGTVNAADKDDPNTYYYINTALKEEFNIEAYQGYQFWENVAVVNRDTVYALMNKKGEVFKRLTGIEQLKFCNEGMLAVKEKGKWGYIDDRGNTVIPAKYDSCDNFKNGYARFRMGSKWGLADKTGKEVVEAKYEQVFSGENGVFIFYDKTWGIMDKNGRITVPARFYSITTFEKDRALARLGKSFTILKSPLVK